MFGRLARTIATGALFFSVAGCSSTETPSEKPVFYPGQPDRPRFQYLKTISSSNDVEEPSWLRTLLVGPRANEERLEVKAPYGAAAFAGKVYVCDLAQGALVLDLEAHTLRPLDRENPQRLVGAGYVAIAADGTKYFANGKLRRIVVYDRDDAFARQFEAPPGEEWRPTGLAVAGDRLYVADTKLHVIYVLDREKGALLARIGKNGSEPGELYFPGAIATDPDGNLLVADVFNCRIQKLDRDGKFIGSFGQMGRNRGDFVRPRGIALDREGRLFVADAAFSNVQLFDKEGKLLLYFGAEPGRGVMCLPTGLLIDYESAPAFEKYVAPGWGLEYVLFVGNQLGAAKIHVYGFLKKLE